MMTNAWPSHVPLQSSSILPSAGKSSTSKSALKRALRDAQLRNTSIDAETRTPFRTAEKHYMARLPGSKPSLENALDLAILDETRKDEMNASDWTGTTTSVPHREIAFRASVGSESRRAYVLPDIPGLVVLPHYFSNLHQRDLIRWALWDHAKPPNETNLDTHYILPAQGLWSTAISNPGQLIQPRANRDAGSSTSMKTDKPSRRELIANEPASPSSFAVLAATPKPPAPPSTSLTPATAHDLVKKLRWANIGWYYHWGTKQYDFNRPKVLVDDTVSRYCMAAVKGVDWTDVFNGSEGAWPEDDKGWQGWVETYEPDAGIVNYYQIKDTLMAHVDRSEVCATAPLVSISLGLPAIFLIGGPDRNVAPTALVLRSGDALIMAGPACRRAYHGVPRILEGLLPSHLATTPNGEEDWEAYSNYMASTRINVNVRQVFPKGFDPAQVLTERVLS